MISIVIPLYNKCVSIQRTLASVLAQTFTDYELIIVNDGSTDGSELVAERVLMESSLSKDKYRIVSKKNGGPSSARNMGIKLAKGEYIALLDADDEWTPDYLETQFELIKDFPHEVIYGVGFQSISKNDDLRNVAAKPSGFRGLFVADWITDTPFKFSSSSVVLKKDVLLSLEEGMFDERIHYGEDHDVWMRMMCEGPAAFDSKICVAYIKDAENRISYKSIPLESFNFYFFDKMNSRRAKNAAFRKWYDTQTIHGLYLFFFGDQYGKAKSVAEKCDFSQLKYSLKFRIYHPRIYRFFRKLRDSIFH